MPIDFHMHSHSKNMVCLGSFTGFSLFSSSIRDQSSYQIRVGLVDQTVSVEVEALGLEQESESGLHRFQVNM